MSTINDNFGVKRFGKPHLWRKGNLWRPIATSRSDHVGQFRNSRAFAFAVGRNDAFYDRWEAADGR